MSEESCNHGKKSAQTSDRRVGETQFPLSESDGTCLILPPNRSQICAHKKEPREKDDFSNDLRCLPPPSRKQRLCVLRC